MSFSKSKCSQNRKYWRLSKLIAELLNSKGEARIVDIAESLGVQPANKTIQRLQTQGYIKRTLSINFLTFKVKK